jgi:hypothetical protein
MPVIIYRFRQLARNYHNAREPREMAEKPVGVCRHTRSLHLHSVTGFGQVVAPQISRDSDVVQAWRGTLLTLWNQTNSMGIFK